MGIITLRWEYHCDEQMKYRVFFSLIIFLLIMYACTMCMSCCHYYCGHSLSIKQMILLSEGLVQGHRFVCPLTYCTVVTFLSFTKRCYPKQAHRASKHRGLLKRKLKEDRRAKKTHAMTRHVDFFLSLSIREWSSILKLKFLTLCSKVLVT